MFRGENKISGIGKQMNGDRNRPPQLIKLLTGENAVRWSVSRFVLADAIKRLICVPKNNQPTCRTAETAPELLTKN